MGGTPKMDFSTFTGRRLLTAVAIVAATVTLVLLTAGRAEAADWPNWRGPDHNGISDEKGWLEHWLKNGTKQLWKKSVGVGYSSVAVVGDRVYTMGNDGKTDTIWCLNADTGEEIWKHTYTCKPAKDYKGPRATPTVDSKNVYTLSREGHVFCLDAKSGTERWKKKLNARPPGWGFSGSPLVFGKLLILNVGSAGVALDKGAGEIAWKSGSGKSGYATPVPFELGKRKCVAIFAEKTLEIVDPAKGNNICRHHWKTGSNVNAADPIISGDKVFISSGYGHGCALLKIEGKKLTVLWQHKRMANHFNSCVLWKGHLYGFDWSNRFKCLDFATGKVKWSQRGFGRQSSLMIAGGKMVIMEARGTLVVAEPSPAGYKELARVKALSGTCWTVPVLSGGRVFCRSHQGELVCIKVAPKPPKPTVKNPKPKVDPVVKKSSPDDSDPARGKLGMAKSYLSAGMKEKAKAILTDIVENHKDSRYARDAKKLLKKIR